ncbi:MAG: UDP-N-acetylmuramoyl-tripeptide--D-alanyl-D-alanine ligase [Legionellales bacterium]|nr:UDP-N-acetylmuramoyl-tripeptide--D-alanyl-D-alanine ligase [Legionellales bacterium]|tara:strand:- start:4056 stop:5414 length:1359 start_codon:yes stop_codon:yes gene_type:complete
MISMSLYKAAKAIESNYSGEDVFFSGCSIDSRTIKKGNLFIAINGENFDGHDYVSMAEEKGAAALLLEREVSHDKPVLKVKDTRKAIGLLARSWREEITAPVVAITGSNGKTTVKEMVRSILSELSDVHATSGNLNNDIGVPLTLFEFDKKHQYAVIEMGANHSGEIEWLSAVARPDVAVITQCAPAHLEGFGDIDGVAKAKAEIYSGLRPSGKAIINADDDYAEFWTKQCKFLNQLSFGIESTHAGIRAKNIKFVKQAASTDFELVCSTGVIKIRLPLSGTHNVMNALAAAACCLSLNVSLQTIRTGLEKMLPVKGRLQIKPGMQGARIIDDTYNANPVSLKAALNVLSSYEGIRYMVMGDMCELGDEAIDFHSGAGIAIKQADIEGLFTIGELSIKATQAYGDDALHFESYAALNEMLIALLSKDTTILVKGSRSMQMERVVNTLTEEQS